MTGMLTAHDRLLAAETERDAALMSSHPIGSLREQVTYTPVAFLHRRRAVVLTQRVTGHVTGRHPAGGRGTALALEFVSSTERPLDAIEDHVASLLVRHGITGNADADTFDAIVSTWIATMRKLVEAYAWVDARGLKL
jgi:hypothetical protein